MQLCRSREWPRQGAGSRHPGTVSPRMIGRERQTSIYLQGVSGRRPRVPIDPERLEAAARRAMRDDAFAYVAGGRRHGGHRAREPRRVRPPPDRPADAARRVERADTSVELFGRRLDSPVLLAPVGVLELAHREADVAVARAARRDRRADDLLQPGVAADGGVRRGARRQPALVPALLEHLRRARREPRRPRRGVRLRGDRGDARHDDGRLAPARPRARLPAVPARPGHRPVHERPGVPPPDGRRRRVGDGTPQPAPTPQALRTLVALTRAYPGSFWRNVALRRRARGRPALHRDLLAAVAVLGGPPVPARAHEAADPAQGHPARRRRAAGARRRRRRDRRLQPRRPPGRRGDRHARRAARRRGGGRRARAGAARQRRARAAPTSSRRSRSARARC